MENLCLDPAYARLVSTIVYAKPDPRSYIPIQNQIEAAIPDLDPQVAAIFPSNFSVVEQAIYRFTISPCMA